MADSPYFDGTYFDQTYFDTGSTAGGRGPVVIVRQPEPDPSLADDDLLALI